MSIELPVDVDAKREVLTKLVRGERATYQVGGETRVVAPRKPGGAKMAKTSPTIIEFVVLGRPQQRGSKLASARYDRSGKPVTKDGRVLTFAKDANPKSKAWMDSVRTAAMEAVGDGWEPLRAPLMLSVLFYFSRPKSHYGSGKNAAVVKASAPIAHSQTPDLSKLMRAVEDGMTGIVYADDRQIFCYQNTRKHWTTGVERAEVWVCECDNQRGE